MVEILKSARTDPHGVDLQKVLRKYQRRWHGLATRRWPWLSEHHGPAINTALQRICTRIYELEDEDHVYYWATLQFVRVMDGFRKAQRREASRRADVSLPNGQDEGDPLDRIPSRRHATEDEADYRARLRIVQSVVQLSREAYLRLMKDLPVGEVARLTGRSPEWIRTFTMRLRRALREYLDDASGVGPPRPPEEIFRKSGLPKELVTKILELLAKMRDER